MSLLRSLEPFRQLIEDRARDFYGREAVFDAIDAWMSDPSVGRMFLLVGKPGTGKTAVVARLAQSAAGEVSLGRSSLGPGCLAHVHFCQAGNATSLSPREFVRRLSESLASKYPVFRDALLQRGAQRVDISTNVATAHAGAIIRGAQVNRLNLEIRGGDNTLLLFEQLVREPLQILCAVATQPIVILVDSLDEAFTYHATDNIPALLPLARELPPAVRFVFTARSGDDRIAPLAGRPALDLSDATNRDVVGYVTSRLGTGELAAQIAERIAASNNFLYAHFVVADLLKLKQPLTAAELPALPVGLDDIYRDYLERIAPAKSDTWKRLYRPVLGTLAVAVGNGVTRAQLGAITVAAFPELLPSDIDDALNRCEQYLVTSPTLRFYHYSFREFLLGKNPHNVYPAERHAAIATCACTTYAADWESCEDEYALRYTPIHLAEAVRGLDVHRNERARALVDIVTDPAYQKRCAEHLVDVPMLYAHVARAIAATALIADATQLSLLVRAANGLVDVRRRYLAGKAVVELARAGDVARAEARLPLFELDRDWQVAAALVVGWLASATNRAGALAILERTRTSCQQPLLSLLHARCEAEVRGDPQFAFDPNKPCEPYVGRQLVHRLTGQAFDTSLIATVNAPLQAQTELIGQGEYASDLDGPLLVAGAREFGADGSAVLEEYIDAHAGYNYVIYRNRSLWVLLHAVLRHHGDQAWVAKRLESILQAALERGGAEPTPMTPVFAEALRAKREARDPAVILDATRTQWLDEIAMLGNTRGRNDSWAIHRRRLAALMEAETLICHARDRSEAVWNCILQLETEKVLDGFAGFRTPAELRLADAARVCKFDPARITDRLDTALRGSHQIQDYHFCARITARVNALRRWHASLPPLEPTLAALAASPADAQFAADHIIGEQFMHRSHAPGQLSLHTAQTAHTLDSLAEVFQRPVLDLLRLNPTIGGATIPIDAGTPVRIPDPGLLPLLATHLAARVLVEIPAKAARTRLLRTLATIAAPNAAALDTILCYLLVAAEPSAAALAAVLQASA